MWQSAFRMFLASPFFGVGTGDYVATMNGYIASGQLPTFMAMFNQPHNIYLFALATNGLPGLAALLFMFFVSLRSSMRGIGEGNEERLFAFLALATIVHYMFAGLTESMFNIQILRYTFAFIIGVCVRSPGKRGGGAA
jgi:O-antigen ligase